MRPGRVEEGSKPGELTMILYYAPGACGLADHIALHEADIPFERVKVDLRLHATPDGGDFRNINPKGYVPALALDDGYVLTENVAILSWIADQRPHLGLGGALGPYRLLETLAFISTEIHKSFKPFFAPGSSHAEKEKASDAIGRRLDLVAGQMEGPWLFGPELSVADPYLFVMLMWARNNELAIPEPLDGFYESMKSRPAVELALAHEGLI
jgi:glutathione S-transferase